MHDRNRADARAERASLVLALLLLAYIFNYLDRQILGILAGPIIADLHLTDTQFGVLSGPPFAILYSVLGDAVRLPCRPDQPQPGDRRGAGLLERLYRPVRHGHVASGSCSSSAWASGLAKRAAWRRPTR